MWNERSLRTEDKAQITWTPGLGQPKKKAADSACSQVSGMVMVPRVTAIRALLAGCPVKSFSLPTLSLKCWHFGSLKSKSRQDGGTYKWKVDPVLIIKEVAFDEHFNKRQQAATKVLKQKYRPRTSKRPQLPPTLQCLGIHSQDI